MTRDLPIVTREDQFADYLARGFTMRQIETAMGISRGAVAGMFSRIRAKLGPQAE